MGASQRRLLAAAASLAFAASSIGSVAPATAAPTTAVTTDQLTKPSNFPTEPAPASTGIQPTPAPTEAAPAATTIPAPAPVPSSNPASERAVAAPTGSPEAAQTSTASPTPNVASESHPVEGAIGAKYETASAILGEATSQEFTNQRFGGAYQLFQNGTIAYLQQYGAFMVIRGINAVWRSIGAQDSELGYPTSDEYANERALTAGGVTQNFQFGKISWSYFNGSRITKGGIGATWDNAGGAAGELGYPTTNEYTLVASGVMQGFEYGKVYWGAATGSHIIKGSIGATWESLGGLGYPTTDEYATADDGVTQSFQYGQIAYSPSTGSHFILGGIRSAWVGQGSEAGRLGYPTTNEYGIISGRAQDFQGGRITWYPGGVRIEYTPDAH